MKTWSFFNGIRLGLSEGVSFNRIITFVVFMHWKFPNELEQGGIIAKAWAQIFTCNDPTKEMSYDQIATYGKAERFVSGFIATIDKEYPES